MAKSFKWIYAKVCLCRICPGVAKRRETRTRRKIRALERQINNEYYDENVCIHSFNIVTVSTPKISLYKVLFYQLIGSICTGGL